MPHRTRSASPALVVLATVLAVAGAWMLFQRVRGRMPEMARAGVRGAARPANGDAATRARAATARGARGPSAAPATPIPYRPDVEQIAIDEAAVHQQIVELMHAGAEVTRARYGRPIRSSHAKAHGLARGTLKVPDGLPPELRQGLFAHAAEYPVLVRLAHVPNEFLDDRQVSAPRGMALKVFDVEGEMLPGHEGELTQDFVLNTGKVFTAPDARAFVSQLATVQAATSLPPAVKSAVSTVAGAAERALHKVGADSPRLDFFGHPVLHPLAEAYYSQCPIRFGDYMAKLAVFPDTDGLRALARSRTDLDGEDGLRTLVTGFLREHPAEYIVAVQLCTDLDRMPIEDARREWPEDESPYRAVARLTLPPQDAWSDERRRFIDEELSFCPSHGLAAHRPLGSVNRARMHVYRVMAAERRRLGGHLVREPRDIEELPIPA